MNNFAAIDFETANRHRSSVCSVGIVIVRNGKICQEIYRLIKPCPNYYNPNNTVQYIIYQGKIPQVRHLSLMYGLR